MALSEAIKPGEQADLKDEILEAIAVHVQTHGKRNWALLTGRPEFATVIGPGSGEKGRRKFWRWVKAVTEGTPVARTKPHAARKAAARHAVWAEGAAATTAGLPVPATPRYLQRSGRGGLQKLEDLGALVREVLEDVNAIRDAAYAADPEAEGGPIRNSNLLLKANKQKLEVVAAAVRLWGEVQQLMENEQLYRGIFEVLHTELAFAPELRGRVIDRIEALFSQAPLHSTEKDR